MKNSPNILIHTVTPELKLKNRFTKATNSICILLDSTKKLSGINAHSAR